MVVSAIVSLSGQRESVSARDETDLLAAALHGSSSAWDALIARYDRKVVVALLARGIRIERAREAAQEAWVRLIDRQRKGELARLELPGLAIVQASFVAIEVARRDARIEPLDGIDAPDGAPSAEQRLLSREDLLRARAAIDRCPNASRHVFQLVFEHPELSHAEVAAQVGLSVQRVRQILCEVRSVVRAALQEEKR